MKMNRRTMIKIVGGVVAAKTITSCGQVANAKSGPKSGSSQFGRAGGNRVVVCGGGWGGVSVARSVKEANPQAEVFLIEKNQVFSSCPMSNLYLSGMMPFYFSDYTVLSQKGINVIQSVINGIDSGNRKVFGSFGEIEYDYLVLSPGIDYMYESVQGLKEAKNHIPIAWKPAAEHLFLKKELENFEGGTMVIGIPKGPIRCPPGPYERVAMMAYHLKKNNIKGKILVFDANEKPMSKGKGFLAAYKDLYGDIVEYHSSHEVEAVDHNKKVVSHSFGDTKYDMANIIPQMKAGELVRMAGVGDRWVNVKGTDFRTEANDRVYVVGDAIGNQGFPKSGFMANSVGVACGQQIARRMAGKPLTVPKLANTCFSTVDGAGEVGQAIKVSHVFKLDQKTDKWSKKGKANVNRSEDMAYAGREWAEEIWYSMLGG